MELKHNQGRIRRNTIGVLIVPSGIETCICLFLRCFGEHVLIVPSGIETEEKLGGMLLKTVLIVPSGIETEQMAGETSTYESINCT